jgi:hypothetical protein
MLALRTRHFLAYMTALVLVLLLVRQQMVTKQLVHQKMVTEQQLLSLKDQLRLTEQQLLSAEGQHRRLLAGSSRMHRRVSKAGGQVVRCTLLRSKQ